MVIFLWLMMMFTWLYGTLCAVNVYRILDCERVDFKALAMQTTLFAMSMSLSVICMYQLI